MAVSNLRCGEVVSLSIILSDLLKMGKICFMFLELIEL